jgi:hypothetical protein
MNTIPEWQLDRAFARVLRKLQVGEISLVDRGANPHAKIALTKRDESIVDIEKKASGLFDACVMLIEKREKCNRSQAIDIALRDPIAREAYDLQRDLYLAKMGGGPNHGRTRDPENPHATTEHDVGEGENDPSARRKAAQRYSAAVQAKIRGGLSESAAHDHARLEHPDGWYAHKMLPPSSDGNAWRPSGASVDAANWGMARSGGRPYGRA